ncbi:MAG: DUF2141 domain-containing protein [Bacteroidota bacterium]
MKKLIIILGLLVVAKIACAQETVSITLEVEGMLNQKGEMRVSVFNSSSTFLKEPFKALKVDLEKHSGNTFTVDGLPKGEYAVSVLHDENENGELDFGGMGPVEGYGFSNNPNAAFGPAKYAEAKLMIETDTVLSIKLN